MDKETWAKTKRELDWRYYIDLDDNRFLVSYSTFECKMYYVSDEYVAWFEEMEDRYGEA